MTAAQTATSPILDILPLLPLQRGMLFHAIHSSAAADDPYVLQVSGRIHGELQAEQVEAVWQTLISRHASLRCAFIYKGQSEPRQAVLRSLPFSISTLDWQAQDSAQQAQQLASLKAKELATPFNLNRPPLLRFSLIQVGPELWDFVLTHHHIIIDGWSQSLLVAEFYELMNAKLAGREPKLPSLTSFQDVVRAALEQNPPVADELFWKNSFANWQGGNLNLPAQREPAQVSSARPTVHLSSDLTRHLQQAARTWRITPATLCQLAWALVLARHSGQRDVVYGVTISGRADNSAALQAIGMFVNTLPLRIVIDAQQPLSALAQNLSEKLLAMEAHSHADLSQIQQWAGVSSAQPLLQSLVAFENFPLAGQEAGVGRLGLSNLSSSERTSLPLALVIVPGNEWIISLQTDCRQIALTSAELMLADFVNALETMLDSWHLPCGQLLDTLAAPQASSAISTAISTPQTTAAFGTAQDLVCAWRAVVQAHAQRSALQVGSQHYSYAQMDSAADVLAAQLLQQGVQPGNLVAICAGRELASLLAMLAVLKVGAAYVPLDPRNPAQRLGAILQDARVSLILLDQNSAEVVAAALASAELVSAELVSADLTAPAQLRLDAQACLSQSAPACNLPKIAANAPAYVIFTSGSTGRPKGVVVSHANVLHLFAASRACFEFAPSDKWSLFHSFAFDFSVWEIWGAWLSGACTVLVPLEVARDPASLVQLVQQEGITMLSQTPSAFNVFAAAESRLANKITSLRWIVFGGEALTLASLQGWVARHGCDAPQLINMYGITETTVHVTWRRIQAADLQAGRGSVIGVPLPHLQMHLMDKDGRPVPQGSIGEIWVGGQGVSAGYLHSPRLTAERFVPDAAATRPGMRAYRSGDLARRHFDGETDYLGRIDHQVKIRGFRIELGEIEQALLQHESVSMVSAGTWQKEAQRDPSHLGLCAWVVFKDANASDALEQIAKLQHYAASKLPAYMVPDCILAVPQIFLTINGKADRSRLPDPALATAQRGGSGSPASTEIEKMLCAAMAQALGRDTIGIDDNYFALGGDSIRSLRFASIAEQKGYGFPLRKLFEFPTVRLLAEWLEQQRAGEGEKAATETAAVAANLASAARTQAFFGLNDADRNELPGDAVAAYPLSRLQAGMLYQAEVNHASALYLDLFSHHLTLSLQQDAFSRAVEALVASHPALRTSFHLNASIPLQVVHASARLQLDWHDLRAMSATQAQQRIAADQEILRCQPYPLQQPGLLRIAVHTLADNTCWLSMGCHHAILDGWSVALLSAQLLQLYEDACHGVVAPLLQNATPQADFVRQEQAVLQNPAARQYWQQALQQLPQSSLPRWGKLSAGQRPCLDLQLATDTGARLQALCSSSGLPVKSWLMAAAAKVFAWSAGSSAFSLGLVVNGRAQDNAGENALGLFLNTIPLSLPARGSWQELANKAFQQEANSHEWRSFPLAELVRMHEGKKPFEVNLNFVHFRPLAGLQEKYGMQALESVSQESTDIPLTINFSIDPETGNLAAKLVADDSFSHAQVQQLATAMETALAHMLAEPQASANCSSSADRAWAVQRFNPPVVQQASEQSRAMLPCQVLQRWLAAPTRAALIDSKGVTWSGAQLLERVLVIAAVLQKHGETHGDIQQRPVALYQTRSVDLIASQVAVTALGGYYVALDVEASVSRLNDILQDLGAPLLLCTQELAANSAQLARNCTLLEVEQNLPPSILASDLLGYAKRLRPSASAYAIYTSGSSGKPKGVLISHAAMENHMRWMIERFEFNANDRVLHRTRPSFDASVWEVWAALSSGAVLVLAAPATSTDPAALLQTVATQRISLLQVVPSLLEALVTEPELAAFDNLRLLFVGGEALRRKLALEACDGRQFDIVNLYGPTETTIDATFEVLDIGHAQRSKNAYIPIGLPISGASAVVVDADFAPVPCGASGELLIGGSAVGQGYLGSPALTAERFVPDPFASQPGARAFRTGDLVRRLEDGRLDYLGRIDRQVKIGGNRIELEEIETVLSSLVAPRRCALAATAASEGAPLRLIAFVEQNANAAHTPHGETAASLRAALAQRLPSYMLPALLHFVSDWPLQASGKTDQAALLRYSAQQLANGASAINALTQPSAQPVQGEEDGHSATTSLLQREISSLLGLPTVSLDSDFFSIGGDSIAAMQLISRVRRLGVSLSARDVFTHRSIDKMVRHLPPPAASTTPASAAPVDAWPLLPIQQWFFTLNLRNPDYYHQTVALTLRQALPRTQLENALRQLGLRHAALGARFDGAQNLVRQGQGEPRLVVLPYSGPQLKESADAANLYQAVDQLQRSMSISNGPLWGAVIGCNKQASGSAAQLETANTLVVVAHHLVIDGVSWRILLDELSTLLSGGTLPALSLGLPFAAQALQAWQADAASSQYWQALLDGLPQSLPQQELNGTENSAAATSVIQDIALTPEQTTQLMQQSGPACKASMEEMLLAAFLHAWHATLANIDNSLLLLEGHGRDCLPELDLSHTVGWFTSQRPLLLDEAVSDLPSALRLAKNRLRSLPGNGAGWLQAVAQNPGRVKPGATIVFNYLGRFDGTVGGSDNLFDALQVSLPAASDAANARSSCLDVVAMIEQQCLRITLDGDETRLGAAGTARLLAKLQQNLVSLSTLAQLQNHAGNLNSVWQSSDFPLARFDSEAQLQQLLSAFPGEYEQFLPCTPLQQGMVFAHQQQRGADYTQQLEIKLASAPQVPQLQTAFQRLCERHPILRTCFIQTDKGSSLQAVQSKITLPWAEHDFSNTLDPQASWQAFLQADTQRSFDLHTAPLLRLTLAKLADDQWRLLWTHHHLISDGWSQAILLQELLQLYLAPTQALPAPATIPPAYWEWLATHSDAAAQQRAKQEWQEYFADFSEPCLVATQVAGHTTQKTTIPSLCVRQLSATDGAQLQQFCRRHGVTLAAVMQAAWASILGKILHSKDVAFGMVVSGRPAEISGSEHWVGMLINTLPVRVQIEAGSALLPWLTQLNLKLAQIQDSAHLALPQIQSWIQQGRAVFDTIVVIENYPLGSVAENSSALAITAVEAHEVNEYPLSLYVEGGNSLNLRYDAARVDSHLVQTIADSLLALLHSWVAGDASGKLGDSAALAPAALEQLRHWGLGLVQPDDAVSVIEKIGKRAQLTPEAIALSDADGANYSYAQLMQQAAQLAAALQAQGVQSGDWVAVMGEHRATLLLGLLAVQLCGAVFIPLDAAFPAARLQMILADCQPKLILHDAANRQHPVLAGYACATLEEILASAPVGNQIQNQTQAQKADALAYILFTSGSSGRPKGVQISQRAFANALNSFARTPGLQAHDVFGAATTISFDISLLELFLPLTVGAQVVMIDKQVARDGVRLAATLAAQGVTAFQGTPSTWKLLCAADCRLELTAWCGGEALSRALRDEMLQRFSAVWNLYGPTETTIWSCVAQLSGPRQQDNPAQVMAGQPIANTSIFIIDTAGQLAPPGAIGEICIGGASVMSGYVGQPQLTADALLPDALLTASKPAALAYRTGDLGRWSRQGELEVLGRRDRQLKLAGYRIELGDIEAALRSIPGVADAAVVLHKIDQHTALNGYVVFATAMDAQAELAELTKIRQTLLSLLPQYMQPAHLMPLPALPLTLNGKLDQRALPLPSRLGLASQQTEQREPQNAVERALLLVWRSTFELAGIGVEDDFFALGGHSFTATQIHAKLARIFRSELAIASIFEATTVVRLAQAVIAAEATPGSAERLATNWLKVQAMTPAERAALRAKIKAA